MRDSHVSECSDSRFDDLAKMRDIGVSRAEEIVAATDRADALHSQFLRKQLLHAGSLLAMGPMPDCMLIARTMLEGIGFISWINEPGFLEARSSQWFGL